MAEVLAGFLTSTVVNIAKDKLASAIAEQATLLWNFGDDMEDMNSVGVHLCSAPGRREAVGQGKVGAAVAQAGEERRLRHLRHDRRLSRH